MTAALQTAPPLPLTSVNHVGRITEKLEASRAFYRDVLGFKEIPRPNFDFPGAWLYRCGLQIHLIVNPAIDLKDGPIEARDNHLAFYVENVDEIESLLERHGVPYRVNIQGGTGLKQIFFHDPDGHTIETATYPPTPE